MRSEEKKVSNVKYKGPVHQMIYSTEEPIDRLIILPKDLNQLLKIKAWASLQTNEFPGAPGNIKGHGGASDFL